MNTILLLLLAVANLDAQIQTISAEPHKLTLRNTEAVSKFLRGRLPSRRAPLSELTEKRLAPLTKDELRPKQASLATQAGVHRMLGADLYQYARWDAVEGNRQLWRLRLHSPQAAGLRIHFQNFSIGAGRVWLHDGSGAESEIMGPYSGRGPHADGDFWSDFVLSDSVVIEYEPERAPDSAIETPPFQIAGLSHLLPGVLAGEQVREAAANCHLDATCSTEWAETAKSVGHMVYEEGGSTYVCTGTLLATRERSGIPYFLTADHCIDNEAAARTLQVFWFYQTARCNGPAPDRRNVPRTLGARYLVSAEMSRGDYSLLQLTNVPDSVTFSGWDTNEQAVGTRVTGIHHPAGDYKRISHGAIVTNQRSSLHNSPQNFYTIGYTEGKAEGGSSGSGLFSRPGVLVGTLSYGPKTDQPNQICNFQPLNVGYGRFATHYPALRDYLEGRTAGPSAPPPSAQGTELASGRAAQLSYEASASATLYTGARGYFVRVPQGAQRLEISLRANVQAGFIVAVDQQPTVANGRVSGDYTSSGYTGNETLVITPQSTPALRAGVYYIGIANFSVNQALTGTLTATIGAGGGTTTPPGGGRILTSGQPAAFNLAAVSNSTLISGSGGYRIQVPAGATRLEIRLNTTTANADLDLFVRFGRDVEVQGNRAVYDFISEGPTGAETIVITPQSTPALQAGTYYIGIGIFTANVATTGTITATVTGGGGGGGGGGATPTNPASGTALTSGVPRPFATPAMALPTLVNGAQGFTIQVPAGATRLDIRLATATSNVDIDLMVRFGADPSATSGSLISDHNSSGPDGNELLSITPQSTPALRAGTYYIALAVFTKGVAANGTITATVTTQGGSAPPPGSGRPLTPGAAVSFNIPAASRAQILSGSQGYTVQVPQGATRLEIQLNTTDASVDVDLFVRADVEPSVNNGKIVADYSSTGPAGSESIVITTASNPPLKPGATYHVALAVFTTNQPINGTLRAVLTAAGGSTTPPTSGGLQSGVPAAFRFNAVTGPTLYYGPNGFFIDVPAGASRLEVRLNTTTPNADLDLFVRRGQDVAIENGRVVYDYTADGPTGAEVISLSASSTPPLAAGRYFIGIAVFSEGVATTGTVTATLTQGSGGGVTAREISPGAPAKFSLPSVDRATLMVGEYGYRITVPEGAARLRVQLQTDDPNHDVDLYLRHGQDVDLEDGHVIADHGSEGPAGSETILIDAQSNPALRAGVYYVAFASFVIGQPVQGTLTVTVERESLAPPLTSARTLTSGVPARFQLAPVSSPTLFQGDTAFRIVVPPQTAQLEVVLKADDVSKDVDLFARFGTEASIEQGRIVADQRSTSDTGEERIVIRNPAPGVHFFNIGLFTTGAPVSGTITATTSNEIGKLSAVEKRGALSGVMR